MRNKQTKSTCF